MKISEEIQGCAEDISSLDFFSPAVVDDMMCNQILQREHSFPQMPKIFIGEDFYQLALSLGNAQIRGHLTSFSSIWGQAISSEVTSL